MNYKSFIKIIFNNSLVKGASAHWWSQRLTALCLIFFGTWFLVSLVMFESYQYIEIRVWIGHPLNSIMLILLGLSLTYHSSLGLDVIIEDYIHQFSLREFCLSLNKITHFILTFILIVALVVINLELFNG
ncbi:succinate dehydrogenase, hydrophobic membrane anchor protein [Woeseiaceae bacterium]|nr:succinate dehydrogenase, hydrophobic membrane anchor protein [Woeseiaceae bacterium]MDB2543696.1 succinate dehydrogenase, hydrophobic membrane anchor protein [Woeseiaceae bacterium]